MWPRRFLVVVLGLLAGIFDVAAASWFPGMWNAVHAALPLVIVLAVFSSRERAFTAAAAAGLAQDVFLPSFGLVTLRLILVAFLIHALAQRFFSNRSLTGSLALGFAGTAVDAAALWALLIAARFWAAGSFVPEVRAGFISESVWTMMVMAAAFFAVAALTRRFLPPVTRRS
jgi:cell shape-determining protein MreD